MKIGMIGMGDIATKAYLPLISRLNAEVHLCSRVPEKLAMLGDQYRVAGRHLSVDSLLAADIDVAFIHTATHAHVPMAEMLLTQGVHVFVDKPVAYDLAAAEKLVALAESHNRTIMCGFNRRYAPAYTQAKEIADAGMIIVQKNRRSLPAAVRPFIFDDFIHVADTLLFFFEDKAEKVIITGRKKGSALYHVTLQLISASGKTAIGVMNRDSGVTEESLEIFSPAEKRVVRQVTDVYTFAGGSEIRQRNDDWSSTLYKRGFEQMIAAFLHQAGDPASRVRLHRELLDTHRLCEQVAIELS